MKKELYDLTIREFILAFLPHSKEWYEDGNKDYYYLVSGSKLDIVNYLEYKTDKFSHDKVLAVLYDIKETKEKYVGEELYGEYNYLDSEDFGVMSVLLGDGKMFVDIEFDKEIGRVVSHETGEEITEVTDMAETREDFIHSKNIFLEHGYKELIPNLLAKEIESAFEEIKVACIIGNKDIEFIENILKKYITETESQEFGNECSQDLKDLLRVNKQVENRETNSNVVMPKELSTDEARKWLQVAINGGLLNVDYSTTDKTRTKPQKALLAEILSDKIGLAHKYKPFETLWNVSGLSKSRYKSKEEKGIVKGGNIIIEVFEGK